MKISLRNMIREMSISSNVLPISPLLLVLCPILVAGLNDKCANLIPNGRTYSRRVFVYEFFVATDLAEQTKLRYASLDKSISCATAFKLQDMNASNVNANLNRR